MQDQILKFLATDSLMFFAILQSLNATGMIFPNSQMEENEMFNLLEVRDIRPSVLVIFSLKVKSINLMTCRVFNCYVKFVEEMLR